MQSQEQEPISASRRGALKFAGASLAATAFAAGQVAAAWRWEARAGSPASSTTSAGKRRILFCTSAPIAWARCAGSTCGRRLPRACTVR
ncbi:MAG: hypothetical protein JWP22_3743 [Ramlibacter sp.]|nr:hypothetical protein [Ramlibacter sp.]